MALLLLKTLQTTHFFSFLQLLILLTAEGLFKHLILQNLLHTHTHTHPKSELLQICVHISCMFKLLTYFSKPVFQIL